MDLGIAERITLLNILPVEGNLTTMRIVKKLRDDLGFTEEELKTHQISQEGDQIRWRETEERADITIGEKATEVVKEAFNRLDKEGKMRAEFLPLFDKFAGSDG